MADDEHDEPDDLDNEDQLDQILRVDDSNVNSEVASIHGLCVARYAVPGDAIMVLMLTAAILALESYKAETIARIAGRPMSNKETLHSILDEAIRHAERFAGIQ